jgi:F-type H+-transporting ATPase subunit c
MEPQVIQAATDLSMLKAIGAGIAALGVLGAGIGLGLMFGKFFEAVARQPSAEPVMRAQLVVGMALAEATAIFALVVALLIIFVA